MYFVPAFKINESVDNFLKSLENDFENRAFLEQVAKTGSMRPMKKSSLLSKIVDAATAVGAVNDDQEGEEKEDNQENDDQKDENDENDEGEDDDKAEGELNTEFSDVTPELFSEVCRISYLFFIFHISFLIKLNYIVRFLITSVGS